MEGKVGKKTLKGKVGKTRATVISDLPESALHHILSHLATADSIRTSELSKQWNSARKSYPFLHFVRPRDKERLGDFFKFVDRSLKHFDHNKLSIERMHLKAWCIDQDSVPLINTWLSLALHNGVSDMEFYARPEVFIYHESTFAVNSSLFSGSFMFSRLENLILGNVSICENIVRNIIRNCPNINHLSLDDINGLETLSISKLEKLVSLEVRTKLCAAIKSVYIDALSLKQIFVRNYGKRYDLTSCCNLRELRLCGCGISDAQLHQHISKFRLLEVLDISHCNRLRRVKISLQRLKHLQICRCNEVKSVEIDAPALLCFQFVPGSHNVLTSVSSKAIRCSVYLSYGIQDQGHFWSLKLREYLGVPFKGVKFVPTNMAIKFTFGPDMSRDVANVDCLDLTGLRIVSSHWVTLLDTLLSFCHPKIIAMTVDSSDEEDNCVNIFRKMLVQSECQLSCNSIHCKCWRRHLKAAKIKNINGIKLNIKNAGKVDHKQFLRVLDTFLSIPVDSEVHFKLNWDHSDGISLPLKSLARFSIS